MKQLNFSIRDSTHAKLRRIKSAKGIRNNADAIEFLIDEVFRRLFGGEAE